MEYCKRLIEVEFPIHEVSRHAAKEKKSSGHGDLSTLHIWWSRKPLSVCRAISLSALLPDPVDKKCPESFRKDAGNILSSFRDTYGGKPYNYNDPLELRKAINNFIARLAELDNDSGYHYNSKTIGFICM